MRGLPTLILSVLGVYTLLYTISAQDPPKGEQPALPCNSCCQGPIGSQGTPGIPGNPGTHGIPGSMGLKGERGESITGDKGAVGEKGDMGDRGLKGDLGMDGPLGPPGDVGPEGIAGPPGTPGVKGQKGEKGQNRLSAFSAARHTDFTPISGGQALTFDGQVIHTNVGDDFDATTGRFTCEIPGIYLFTYSIMSRYDEPYVLLMKNETHINSVWRQLVNKYDMASNSAVLQLAAGDQVWLSCHFSDRVIFSDDGKYTTFSGVLLNET